MVTTSTIDSEIEQVMGAFRSKLIRLFREEAKNKKCPLSNIEVIGYAIEKKDPTMKEIAIHLNITPPSTTVLVESMIKKGFLKRIKDSIDRRTIRVALTPKACKTFASFQKRKSALIRQMLSSLDTSERKTIITIITKLTNNL